MFVYRPMAIAEPFARGHAARHPLRDVAREVGVELIVDTLAEIDGASRTAITAAGDRLSYDALVVAVGARSEAALGRGLTWTPEHDPELFSGLLRDLEEGYTKRVAFIVPPGVAWPLPAYELALMTAWQAWGMGQDDVEVTVYIPDVDGVWAAGDAIAFPVKQGGLAAQQADAAAEAIAAVTGADVEPQPFRPVLRGMMLTGRGSVWMRSDLSGGAGEGTVSRRALWWPPTKIAGRYLFPLPSGSRRLAGGR